MCILSNITRNSLVLLVWLTATMAHGQNWTPSDLLLNVIRQIESAQGRMVVGDQGRSLGAYQLSRAAWRDVDQWRQARSQPVVEYETGVWCEEISRSYAADYLSILGTRLAKSLRRPPSPGEVYAAYNMGLTAFAKCEYSLGRVNRTTALRCCQIDQLVPADQSVPDAVEAGSNTLLAWQAP